ncbi:MAG TPA: universal stress protein, partial [Usitatibacter sp.]|nr:universal stress protein [Usitatibacter sp.]
QAQRRHRAAVSLVAHFPAGVRNVLVVAGGLLDARATAAMLGAMHARESVRIHLLAIAPGPSGYAGSLLGGIDIAAALEDAARAKAAPLCEALDAARTPYRLHLAAGRWLETIERHARDLGCARVIVGDNPRRLLHRLVLRHDRWRIESFLRGQGVRCAVIHREGAARRGRVAIARNASHSR